MMKLISYNVNHSHNLGGLLHQISGSKPDICFLQEVPQSTEELSTLVQRHGYLAYSSLGPQDRPGVAVIYKINLLVQEILPLDPGYLLLVKLENKINFLNIYAPSGTSKREARRQFFGNTILRNISLRANLPILIGDFNCVLSPEDCEYNYKAKTCPALKELVTLFQYTDMFRSLHPQAIEFTFYRPHLSPSRLDRIYAPNNLKELVSSVQHMSLLSDHKALILELNIPAAAITPKTKASYWKLNTSILQDDDFIPNFLRVWEQIVQQQPEFESLPEWWEECFKPTIKTFLIKFSVMRAYGRKQTKLMLFTMLDLAKENQDWEEVAHLKARIKKMVSEDTQGYLIRSRTKEHAEEEKGSLFHVNREVKNGNINNLESLVINGSETKDKALIEEEVTKYFQALLNGHHRTVPGSLEPVDTGEQFIPDNSYLPVFLQDLEILEQHDKQALEVPISLEELKLALDSCESQKSPGLDGLSYELYKRVFSMCGSTMVDMFNQQLNSDQLILSNRSGVTRLISKVKGIPAVHQLRPITLLSCDYKLLTKILASRLNSTLPKVLQSNQLCTNAPKNILFGGLELLSAIEYLNIKNLSGFLVSFDIFKAYDKTTIQFICHVMKAMGFGETFISWMKMLHNNITTRFILGDLSEPINILISLRQGDPLAMPLFLINMEPLLRYINKNIKGLQLGGIMSKDQDYVDDISAISTEIQDLFILDETFALFEKVSGTVLNRSNKSKIMGLGGWRDRQEWPLPWLKPENKLKIFGIHFLPTIKESQNASWEACTAGFRSCLHSWSSRFLPTLSQRVMVLSTFAMSKLWYLAQILPIPKKVVEQLEKEVRGFLWRGRIEKLPLEELYAPVKEGGLGLPSIQAKGDALLMKQLCRILDSPGSTRDHLSYWIGMRLRSTLPDLRGHWNTERVGPYFNHISNIVKEAVQNELVNPEFLNEAKTAGLYKNLICTPPPPKVQYKRNLNWEIVWTRLESPVLSKLGQDLMFSIIHDIYPSKDRLFRLNQHPTGNCQMCRGTTETTEHLFTSCIRSRPTWIYIKILLDSVCNTTNLVNDQDIFMLALQNITSENAYIFIVSNYCLFIHSYLKNDETITISELKVFLKDEYLKHRNMRLPTLGDINF